MEKAGAEGVGGVVRCYESTGAKEKSTHEIQSICNRHYLRSSLELQVWARAEPAGCLQIRPGHRGMDRTEAAGMRRRRSCGISSGRDFATESLARRRTLAIIAAWNVNNRDEFAIRIFRRNSGKRTGTVSGADMSGAKPTMARSADADARAGPGRSRSRGAGSGQAGNGAGSGIRTGPKWGKAGVDRGRERHADSWVSRMEWRER